MKLKPCPDCGNDEIVAATCFARAFGGDVNSAKSWLLVEPRREADTSDVIVWCPLCLRRAGGLGMGGAAAFHSWNLLPRGEGVLMFTRKAVLSGVRGGTEWVLAPTENNVERETYIVRKPIMDLPNARCEGLARSRQLV